jgi:hypothetical protein
MGEALRRRKIDLLSDGSVKVGNVMASGGAPQIYGPVREIKPSSANIRLQRIKP